MAKILTNVGGVLTEVATNSTSAGAADSGKVVSLNASGLVDDTIINAKNTSAGAGDAGKIPKLNASGILDDTIINAKNTSAGAGDAGKITKLDSAGKLDMSMMPVGLGAETDQITASEALAAGDFVNIWANSGVKCRKADASTAGKKADGFVLSAVSSAATATVYRISQSNTQLTGMTPGAVQYLSQSTAGGHVEVCPSTAGQVVQILGIARSATELIFAPGPAITLA